MRNMKVSMKLIVSFLIVVVLMAVVGVAGIIGLSTIEEDADAIYTNQMVPTSDLSQLTTLLQRMRVNMREYSIAVASNNEQLISTAKNTIDELNRYMTAHFDAYAPTMTNPEGIALFNEARELFDGKYQDFLQQSYENALAGDLDGGLQVLEAARTDTTKIVENLDRCMEIRLEVAGNLNTKTTVVANTLFVLIIVILVIAVVVSILLALYVSGLISKPLGPFTAFMQRAGSIGDITLSSEEAEIISKFAKNKDEVGQMISAASSFVGRINETAQVLEKIAGGDLTTELSLLSDKDAMGLSLQKMIRSLNLMFNEINVASSQVSTGSSQVADGAQALAAGATQQAASIEELSSSIAEIAQKTKENAVKAEQAATLANTIKGNAEKGSNQMEEMMIAAKGINDANQSISKVIKTIDDIAFQTNILALNAAVEAARAGQHGKGFAVVADEVRNLASKSASAAKETASMIANSMEKAELGVNIAGETAASLSEIMSGINESNTLIAGIAKSSDEQTVSISQINTGVDQVAQVVQQNSATAEESAAASEEMSGQAVLLQQLISRFKLNNGSMPHQSSRTNTPKLVDLPRATGFALVDNGDKYDKY
jgi:methyl-accepting chemotaxis protein